MHVIKANHVENNTLILFKASQNILIEIYKAALYIKWQKFSHEANL